MRDYALCMCGHQLSLVWIYASFLSVIPIAEIVWHLRLQYACVVRCFPLVVTNNTDTCIETDC